MKTSENPDNILLYDMVFNNIECFTARQKEALYYKLQHILFKDDIA